MTILGQRRRHCWAHRFRRPPFIRCVGRQERSDRKLWTCEGCRGGRRRLLPMALLMDAATLSTAPHVTHETAQFDGAHPTYAFGSQAGRLHTGKREASHFSELEIGRVQQYLCDAIRMLLCGRPYRLRYRTPLRCEGVLGVHTRRHETCQGGTRRQRQSRSFKIINHGANITASASVGLRRRVNAWKAISLA